MWFELHDLLISRNLLECSHRRFYFFEVFEAKIQFILTFFNVFLSILGSLLNTTFNVIFRLIIDLVLIFLKWNRMVAFSGIIVLWISRVVHISKSIGHRENGVNFWSLCFLTFFKSCHAKYFFRQHSEVFSFTISLLLNAN